MVFLEPVHFKVHEIPAVQRTNQNLRVCILRYTGDVGGMVLQGARLVPELLSCQLEMHRAKTTFATRGLLCHLLSRAMSAGGGFCLQSRRRLKTRSPMLRMRRV